MSYDRPSRRSLGHTIQGRPYIGTGRQKLVRSAGRRRDAVLGLERLEDRTLLAMFTDAAPALTLTLAKNEAVGIVATNAGTYTLDLTSGTWSGTDVTNQASGNGTATLTVTEAAFNLVVITDTGTGTSVAFNDSMSNAYASSFDIALTMANSAAASIAFNGATSFTGSNALDAATNGFIVANPGSSVTTVSGGITLSANQQMPSASGTFVGINVNDAMVQSATGPITLEGTGGNSGSDDFGVEIQAGAEVQMTPPDDPGPVAQHHRLVQRRRL
jgi:hypothetical protein